MALTKIMINKAVLTTTLCLGLSTPILAENLSHLSQLLSTKECPFCDLAGSGLVMSNLAGANLRGANLMNANLSQANLSGADLSGSDLRGASLYGANLSNTNLDGANLEGADLRNAYLYNSSLVDVSLERSYVQGAVGIPTYAATIEQFQEWGLAESQKGNYQGAVAHFNRALSLDPNYADAYLGRGLAQYYQGNDLEATQDAQTAAQLYEVQNNSQGYQASTQFLQAMQSAREATQIQDPGPDMANLLRGVAGLALQFLIP